MKNLMIRVPDEIADALHYTALDINKRYKDNLTSETLAASLLKAIIEDDAAAEGRHLRVIQ